MFFFTILTKVPFPAVTICPQNSITNRVATSYKKFGQMTEQQRYVFFNNNLIEPDSFHEAINILCPRLLNNNLPMQRYFYDTDLFEALKFLAPLKSDTFLACGKENVLKPDCSRLFQKIITKKGVCYTFNGISLFHLYRDDV